MRLKQRHERAVLGIDALDDADLAIEYAGVVVVYELDDAIAGKNARGRDLLQLLWLCFLRQKT